MSQLDEKYHNLARDALFKSLNDCRFQDDVSTKVEKSEILRAFDYSGSILRSNSGGDHYRLADAVFETCIRLTQCLFYPPEARIVVLRGKRYSINADQQLEVMRRDLKELEQYES